MKFSSTPSEKEKEIIVWIRLQETPDKNEILDFIQTKFGLDTPQAEMLYYKATPETLTPEQVVKVQNVSQELACSDHNLEEITNILDTAKENVQLMCNEYDDVVNEFLELVQISLNTPKK